MKLRIRENTVRIRLTQSEVAVLAEGGTVEQTTWFSPTQKLVSSVRNSPSLQKVLASFDDGSISIVLPQSTVQQWAAGDQVGIEAEQMIDTQRALQILIEKDFECLHGESEGIVDAYPNPRKSP